MKGGTKVVVEPHRHEGIFVARGKEDALVTLNSTPGVAVYGEKRISVETPSTEPGGAAVKTEYRVWNPFRSKSKYETNGKGVTIATLLGFSYFSIYIPWPTNI